MDQIIFFMHLSQPQCCVINRSKGVKVLSGGSLIEGHAIYQRCPALDIVRCHPPLRGGVKKTELNPIRPFLLCVTLSRYR